MLKYNPLFIRNLTLVVLLCLSFYATSCGGGDNSKTKNEDTELALGSDYPLIDDVTACVTEKDLDELGEFVTANDEEGFAQKVVKKTGKGTAFRLEKGIKVRLIDRGFGWVKVRVLEEPYQNQMGYFDTEFIKGFEK